MDEGREPKVCKGLKNHECMKKLPLCCCVKIIACNQNVSFFKNFNRRTPYVMKDFLHNESCLEKYYACWQGSLISMVYFDKLTYFFGDNLVFVLHFNVIGNFDKCISHHTLTKFSSFKQKCEHQSITVFSGWFFQFFMWSSPDFKNKFQIIRLLRHVQAGKQNIKGFLNF